MKRPVANTSAMLQGWVPGLRVLSSGGQPGAESVQFRIRGQGTWSGAGSDPLILINGVEGDLSTLDPYMIEQVSVLKDAASASIYGARAANGVILVTTKNGTEIKDHIAVSYRGNYAIHSAINLLDLVWDSPTYMTYWNLAKKNSGRPTSEMYTEEMIAAYTNPADPGRYPSFNWLDYMFRRPFVHRHNLNVTGTTGKTSYNLSLSMIDQPGTLRGHGYERYNVGLDMISQIRPGVRTGIYFSGSRSKSRETRQGDTDAYLSTISQAPTYTPWLPDDGSGVTRWAYKAYPFEANNKNMAAYVANGNLKQYTTTDLHFQNWWEVELAKGWAWYTKGAVRYKQQQYKDRASSSVPLYYTHTGDPGVYLNTGGEGLTSVMYSSTYLNLYSYLKYDRQSADKDHSFTVMAGGSVEDQTYDHLQGYRQYFYFDLHELDAGDPSVQTASGYSEEWALLSAFFRFNYNYQERYLAEVNGRIDGSSRIAPGSRWGWFPSFSLGWRITEEPWIKEQEWEWLTDAKIRGSYGILGNQAIDLYSYYAKVTTEDAGYSFDNTNLEPGVVQKQLNQSDLKWESTSILDLGFDLTLFAGLNITWEWYKKKTFDILRQAQVSGLLGLTAPYVNDGEMQNKGIEVNVSYENRVSGGICKDLYYRAGFYVDRSRNKLVRFGAPEYYLGTVKAERLPYHSFYTWEAIGIFKDQEEIDRSPVQFNDNTLPGDIKYRDVSGPEGVPDGIIDAYDKVVIPGRYPNFEYGISLGLNWKNMDLSLHGQGVQGIRHFAGGWGMQPFYQGSPVSKDYIAHMWTEENPAGTYPRLYFDDLGGAKNNRESSYWIHNASYFRLKNLTLGYIFPEQWVRNIPVRMLRVYFSGDNLWTCTKYPQRGDPERHYDSVHTSRLVYYPQNKVYSFGIQIDF